VLAYYVHDLSPFLVHFGGAIGIRFYGLAYLLGFVFGIWLYRWLAQRGYSDLRPEEVPDFIIWGAIFGVLLGGRLGYMLLYDFDAFLADPLIIFRVWDGGMASHGGFLGMALYTLWYARRHRVSWLNLGDNIAVVAPIGLFFGRCANFINGELYGRVASVPWAVQFPKEILVPGNASADRALEAAVQISPAFNSTEAIVEGSRHSAGLRAALAEILPPRHPSQIYEAFLEGVLLFALMFLLRTRFRLPNGVLAGISFIAYAAVRFAGECFREPDAPMVGALTRGQFYSLFMVLTGVAFIAAGALRPRYPHPPTS